MYFYRFMKTKANMEAILKFNNGKLEPLNNVMLEMLNEQYKEGDFLTVEVIKPNAKSIRTKAQNSAIHLYLTKLCRALNGAGFDMKRTLKEDVEISWNMANAKDYLWRPIQKAMFDKESTAELETGEVSEVFNHLSRHLGQKTGVYVEFPSRYTEGLE